MPFKAMSHRDTRAPRITKKEILIKKLGVLVSLWQNMGEDI
jgi:hypothetical protein